MSTLAHHAAAASSSPNMAIAPRPRGQALPDALALLA
jgi:hypothetical protein